jgi:8-oxo-dGTP pyrophosphatase MutT (NUDIX family)
LTKRTEDVEHHKGQISFPGGSQDSDDENIVATALRETEEEIGLDRKSIEVLGTFDDYETPSGFAITNVIGYVPSLPRLTPNRDEVAEILEIPVNFFLEKVNERVVLMERPGTVYRVYFYNYNSYEIWGATAGMIHSFLKALNQWQGV